MINHGNRHGSEVILTGLSGGNLLGFLAALGTFRVLSLALPSERIRLSWKLTGGAWRPVLHFQVHRIDDWFAIFMAALGKSNGCRAMSFADNPSVDAPIFLEPEQAAAEAATIDDRIFADFMAALGSSAWCNDKKKVLDTAFRTMQGAGHQYFLKTMRDLVDLTTDEQIRNALFEPWMPNDKRLGMRWDACENRPNALRWRDPSKETVLTVRGANRVAIEALPLFPVVGDNRNVNTTGFTFPPRRNPRFSFPIWDSPITLDTVRSLLAYELIQQEVLSGPRLHLSGLGIQVVYRCERFNAEEKFRNFTPAFSA
jgi:hypothetical protein